MIWCIWDVIKNKIFNPFTCQDEQLDILPLDDIDPDDNYYNDICNYSSTSCRYYLQDEFNHELLSKSVVQSNAFSLCHFNIRSLQKNFTAMSSFLECLEVFFTCIGVTETWNTDNNYDLFNLDKYNFIENHRTTRKGGGVGLYIRENLEYTERKDLDVFNEMLESLFVELSVAIDGVPRNIIIGIVYRPPGRDLADFNDHFCEILTKIKSENKNMLSSWRLEF